MITLTNKQAAVLDAFLESFDLRVTGAWSAIEAGMIEDFGIEDPEADLEEARAALRGE